MVNPASDTAETVAELWRGADDAIRGIWEDLNDRIESAQSHGQPVDQMWLWREIRYRELLTQITEHVGSVAQPAAIETAKGQVKVTEAAQSGQLSLFDRMAGVKPKGVSFEWNRVPVETINALIGFASDGSPLADLFNAIGPDMARHATQVLVNALVTGVSPRAAGLSIDTVLNVGAARAETIARTEMLRAAREASRQTYIANTGSLEGWIWYSARNNGTCASCWAMHGTMHDVSETLDDHPNGCCVMVPRTKSWGDLLGDDTIPDTRPEITSGLDEFAGLLEERQKTILGPSLYALYQSGDIGLIDVVTQAYDERWGTMRRPATIAEAVANAGTRL